MTVATPESGGVMAELSPELARQWGQMITLIPSDDAGGYENILEQILHADHWDQLDTPWDVSKAERLAGKILRIDSITRRPSDFRSGFGFFLVARAVDARTGEVQTIVTSAVSVVAQLIRAYSMGAFPVFVEFVISERPTQDGYHPHHLVFHGSGAKSADNEPAEG